jgi:heat-inducible transcriptional repressor
VLTPRQEELLERVIRAYLDTGVPVGSKALAESTEWSSSTIRYELAALEEQGLLDHPYTSAGRVPTDVGYRRFVDRLLPQVRGIAPSEELSVSLVRREVDEAMRVTSEALSQITDLLAIVTAPPLETATIRHVEVLVLQPQVLMVVIITSTGGVTKRLFAMTDPIDSGLARWAGEYLNEALVGMGLGARMLSGKLADPTLDPREQVFLETIAPAFTELEDTAAQSLYLEGTTRLLSEHRVGDVAQLGELMNLLERRVTLLGVLSEALGSRDTFVSIGSENRLPVMHDLAVVAQSYGLPARSLGTVSVIGPVRMDYEQAIRAVRAAAAQLSRFVEDVYAD